MSIQYFLGYLVEDKQISAQVASIREMIFSDKIDSKKLNSIIVFLQNHSNLDMETVKIINIALLCRYGSEYMGVGGDDNGLKLAFYNKLRQMFPSEISFKFKYADIAQMAGEQIELIFPVLKSGLINDNERKYYPTAELFEMIHESKFSFDFDMILLENYYQPCEQEIFDDY